MVSQIEDKDHSSASDNKYPFGAYSSSEESHTSSSALMDLASVKSEESVHAARISVNQATMGDDTATWSARRYSSGTNQVSISAFLK